MNDQEAVSQLDFPFRLSDPVPKRVATGIVNTFVTLVVLSIFISFWYVYLVRLAERQSIGAVSSTYQRTIDDLLSPLPDQERTKYEQELNLEGMRYYDANLVDHNVTLDHNLAYTLIGFLLGASLLIFLVGYFVRPPVDADGVIYSSGSVLGLLFITDLLFFGVYEYPFKTVNESHVSLQIVRVLRRLT